MKRLLCLYMIFLSVLSSYAQLPKDSVMDVDGNVYHTVTIGTQTWMVENLRTTRYNDSTLIPFATTYDMGNPRTTEASYTWYHGNEDMYKRSLGALYSWDAVNTHKLAPKGWHIPTDEEWTQLTTFLGGEGIAGAKLKETDAKLKETGTFRCWCNLSIHATNESGFSAIPAGAAHKSYDGSLAPTSGRQLKRTVLRSGTVI